MGRISVIIPAYKGDRRLEEIVSKVVSDPYPDKEVIVVVDEPDPAIIPKLQKVKLIVNWERVGKARALNQAIGASTGDILLFLDADTLPGNDEFLSTIVSEIGGYDVLDVKKVVPKGSFLQRMIYYEYVGFNVASWLLSRKVGKVLGINGACFAVKREFIEKVGGIPYTISEDLDLGLRLAEAGARFKYTSKAFVYTGAPKTWEGWLKQRKRWAFGLGQWLKTNLRSLLKEVLGSPAKYLISVILLFPSLIAGVLAALFGEPLLLLLQVSLLSSLLPLSTGLKLIGVVFIPGSLKNLSTYLFSLASGFLASWVAFRRFSQKLKYDFDSLEFLAYILVYSPIWLALVVYGILMAVMDRKPEIGWVVKEEESLI